MKYLDFSSDGSQVVAKNTAGEVAVFDAASAFASAGASPLRRRGPTSMPRAREIREQHRGAVVTPAPYEAATNAGPWRERGIPVYGLRPYRATAADLQNMHGIDERVSVTGLNQGKDMIERILRAVATG
jgi:acetylornithine deacetylase/succinyl-diaminopimelate desuccinylase-like protein